MKAPGWVFLQEKESEKEFEVEMEIVGKGG